MSGAGDLPDAVPGTRWWPWKVAVFLLFATALSYLDRQALNVVAPLVKEDLRLDNAQLGALFSAFLLAYGVMHLFVGFFLDRFNIRVVYVVFVALWSVCQVVAGLVRSFEGLRAARFGLGTFEAAGQPGAARIISRILPAKDRAFANGIMMSGGSVGAMLAPLLMIYLAQTLGWRTGFIIVGALGLVWSLAFFAWFRPPSKPDQPKGAADNTASRVMDSWRVILRNPRFWACVVGALLVIPIIHIVSAWTAVYFAQAWKMKVDFKLGGFLFLTSAGLDVGFLAGGAAVSLLIRRGAGVGKARKVVLLIAALLMFGCALVPFAPHVGFAVALLFLLHVGRAAWGAIFLAFNQDIAPGRVGMIAGIMGAIGALTASLLVWIVGVLSQGSGFAVPFVMIGLMPIAATIPFLLLNWDRGDTEPSAPHTSAQAIEWENRKPAR